MGTRKRKTDKTLSQIQVAVIRGALLLILILVLARIVADELLSLCF